MRDLHHLFTFMQSVVSHFNFSRFLYATRSPVDFISINYRYFDVDEIGWSHSPRCMQTFLKYLFNDTGISNDANRHFGNDSTLFWSSQMTEYAAAQFAVSKLAILQRPLAWWRRLLGLSSEIPIFATCNQWRTWSDGSVFTQLLERIWHNFFRSTDELNPLVLPKRTHDRWLPAFLRVDYCRRQGTVSLCDPARTQFPNNTEFEYLKLRPVAQYSNDSAYVKSYHYWS